MLPIAILHAYAFGYATYRDPERDPLMNKRLYNFEELKPIARTVGKNVGGVFSPKDIVDDAVEVFGIGEGARVVSEKVDKAEEKVRRVMGVNRPKGDTYGDITSIHRAGVVPSYQNIETDIYSSDSDEDTGL